MNTGKEASVVTPVTVHVVKFVPEETGHPIETAWLWSSTVESVKWWALIEHADICSCKRKYTMFWYHSVQIKYEALGQQPYKFSRVRARKHEWLTTFCQRFLRGGKMFKLWTTVTIKLPSIRTKFRHWSRKNVFMSSMSAICEQGYRHHCTFSFNIYSKLRPYFNYP